MLPKKLYPLQSINIISIHKYIRLVFFILIWISMYSCLNLEDDDYLDVNYFTPKITPSEQTLVVLKNVYEYHKTGTVGGTNTKTLSSEWYLVKYNLTNRSITENKIPGFDIGPYWINKGITSATNSYITIVTSFREYIININTLEIEELPEDLEVIDNYLEPDNRQIIMIEGFFDQSVL